MKTVSPLVPCLLSCSTVARYPSGAMIETIVLEPCLDSSDLGRLVCRLCVTWAGSFVDCTSKEKML